MLFHVVNLIYDDSENLDDFIEHVLNSYHRNISNDTGQYDE